MVVYKQASTESDLRQILALQQRNLPKNLSQEEIKQEGFLTVEHDFELLKKMNDKCAHTIATIDDKVIAYLLSMHPKFAEEIAVLKPMFAEITKVVSKSERYIIMGQVCVAKSHRGQGIFRGLYTHMQQFLQPTYTKIITEVDVKNSRSMQAHKAMGFVELKRYEADGKEWSLIILG
ncbi:GNAT family N-acetyltransferase [Allomuricauda sp. d1]|uniref:GNAT family N-acetyltransferase n=1 Tax=Allomuricauda sp. d1 TaxID=3136725 RepID=UPI0031E07ACA